MTEEEDVRTEIKKLANAILDVLARSPEHDERIVGIAMGLVLGSLARFLEKGWIDKVIIIARGTMAAEDNLEDGDL